MEQTLIFIFGLLVGSFINVCIYRIPRKESILFPSSHCPGCNAPVRYYDNIPIVSFLLLRGRCRTCKSAISWQYPIVELVHASGYLLMIRYFGYSIETIIYAVFFSSLLALTVIDFFHQILPDRITLPGIIFGFIAGSFLLPRGPADAAVGLVVGGGLFYLIAILSLLLLKKEGMGGGDIKLAAYMGALLGWQKILMAVFLASLAGSLIGLGLLATGLRRRSDPIPFGPFLALGGLIALLWGNAFYDGYF